MLRRIKRWLLAMLARKGRLRVAPVLPRKSAALLTRPPLRGVLNLSGRRASRQSPPLRGGRTKGICLILPAIRQLELPAIRQLELPASLIA
jgi:hypothetical protein